MVSPPPLLAGAPERQQSPTQVLEEVVHLALLRVVVLLLVLQLLVEREAQV
jgi:hypothetical protein